MIENSLGHPTRYLYCTKGSRIVGILPLAHVKSLLFGNALISLPFLVYGGIIADDEAVERLLIEAACREADSRNVDYLEFRCQVPSERGWPASDMYATFRKELDPDPEKNLSEIPRKQRAMIRKGIKAGLVAERDEDTGRFYRALTECKRNLGTPFFGPKFFADIRDTFGEKAELLTVTKDRRTVCAVMSFRFRNEILPYYGGGGDEARILKGNDFMYWAVMERACTEGVKIFDYGRSRVDSGAYRFKKHWGFEPTPLSYEYYLGRNTEIPQLNPDNPKYKLLIATWKRLPLAMASIMGPPIARRLG